MVTASDNDNKLSSSYKFSFFIPISLFLWGGGWMAKWVMPTYGMDRDARGRRLES